MGFFPSKNTRMDYHFLLQGIFLMQGSNQSLLHFWHWQIDSLPLCHLGSPRDEGAILNREKSMYGIFWTGSFKLLPYILLGETAAAKSLQSCPTLCNPIDGSPPGSPIPGILQARILEWVAICCNF